MSHNHYKGQNSNVENTVAPIQNDEVKTDSEKSSDTPVVETKVEETPVAPKVPEVKKEDKKNNNKVVAPVPKEEVKATPVVNVTPKVGKHCKLKSTVKQTISNKEIPEFAYRNTYKISKVLADRVIIQAGLTYTLAVKPEDIEFI